MKREARAIRRDYFVCWIFAAAFGIAIWAFQQACASGSINPARLHGDTAQNTHLYIAGGISGIPGVYRFPIVDGLPSRTPDEVLTGGHPVWPFSVAFDALGFEYVSDTLGNTLRVYAPGSSGDTSPIRVIPNLNGPTWIAATKGGYLFVVNGNYAIETFAPGAGDPTLPPPKPLYSFGGTPSEESFGVLLVDDAGRLYAQTLFKDIFVYDDPLHHWEFPDRDITAQPQVAGYAASPMALEPERNQLWFQAYNTIYPYPWAWSVHEVRDLAPRANFVLDALTTSRDCHHGSLGGDEYGMVVDRKYLIFSCPEYGVAGAVLVYRNAPGKQKLVEVISPQGLTNPAAMTFGP